MEELIRLFRTMYIISKNSEKHEVIIDEETLKVVLNQLNGIKGTLTQQSEVNIMYVEPETRRETKHEACPLIDVPKNQFCEVDK